MKIIFNILIIGGLINFASCMQQDKSNLDVEIPEMGESVPQEESATFELLQQRIFTPKCITCHESFTQKEVIDAHLKPGDPEASLIFTRVEKGEMPPTGDPLSTEELELIRSYIESLSEDTSEDEQSEDDHDHDH